VPIDDEPDDDRPRPDPPLPPEDRLWRHPSELGRGLEPPAAWMATPQAVASAGSSSRHVPAVGALAGACLAGALVAVGAMWLTRPTRVVEQPAATSAAARSTATSAMPSFAVNPVPTQRLAKQLSPTVATVRVERDGRWATGSAVWIDDAGLLATAAPLVAGATRILVIGDDGRSRTATVAGTDPATGITALTVDRTAGTPMTAADGPADTGQAAALVGAGGVDAGEDTGIATIAGVIVRAATVRASVGDLVLHDAIQLDRAVPADAVGGALVDSRGHVLGLAVGNSTERGLGAVAPAASLADVCHGLRDDGKVRRAWLGIEAVDLDPGEMAVLDLAGGARLTSVTPGSPADDAGLRVGDVVTAIDEDGIDDASDLVIVLRSRRPGQHAAVHLRRGDASRRHLVTLGG
jgi:S1-C subfamily serine protease